MKDIGLGVLDTYTVVITLVILVLANVLFGYQIPLDTTNASQLLISLVIFTGYIYAARSIVRFPILAIKALIHINDKFWIFGLPKPIFYRKHMSSSMRQDAEGQLFVYLFLMAFYLPFYWCFVILDLSGNVYEDMRPGGRLKKINENKFLQLLLFFLDRVSIILIAFVAVLPTNQTYIQMIGVFGIFFMLVIFILKGNFSALIADELSRKIKKIEEAKSGNPIQDENSNDSVLTEKRLDNIALPISRCLICQKVCTADGAGVLPKLCSLECQQKWFVAWEKDWCIRNGQERYLLDNLRKTEYANFVEVKAGVEKLKNLASEQAMWTLLAMIRDLDGLSPREYIQDSQKTILDALTVFAQEKDYAIKILNACILDENLAVIEITSYLLAEKIPADKTDEISSSKVRPLLQSTNRNILNNAVKIFTKSRTSVYLISYIENNEKFIDETIVYDIISSLAKKHPKIYELKRLQRHKASWIREYATQTLQSLKYDTEMKNPGSTNHPRSDLFDIREPDLVIDKVVCPRCERKFLVDIPKGATIFFVDTATLRDKISFQPRLILKCPLCYLDIHIYFRESSEDLQLASKLKAIKEAHKNRQDDVTIDDAYHIVTADRL